MERADLLAALERDGSAFADSCAAAGLTQRVEGCPEWTVADLLWHMGGVHHFFSTLVRDRMLSYEGYHRPPRPADDQLLTFFRSTFTELLQVLTDVDPSTPVWTWAEDQTAGFVVRRMAHETAMHRWDADRAAKRDMPIEAQLASDGIDEFLQHFLERRTDDSVPPGGSVHIHCTDVAGEWTVRPTASAIEFVVVREHAKGDCAIRGPASDILLALWRRQPLSTVDVIGDAEVAARFVAFNGLT
jgi:uncharacterized protein (TIGR03083 family)